MQTDYSKVNNLLLAYPERFYNEYESLRPFYDALIDAIPETIELWVVCNNQSSAKKIKERFFHKEINTLAIKGWDEIWLRDCIGLKKGKEIIKPLYYPSYCEKVGTLFYDYYNKINKLSKAIINECITDQIINMPLKLDGGNFVNNNSIAFLTDKVMSDNRQFAKGEIISIIKDFTGLQAIIISRSQNDNVGHLDSHLAFASSNKAYIPNYPSLSFLKDDIDILYRLRTLLKEERIETCEMYDRPIDEGVACNCHLKNKKNCFSTARGNYMNFLRLNDTIVLPEYTLPTQKETKYYNSINKEILEKDGFQVTSLNCDQLSKMGGSLHCISYTF